MPSQRSLEAFHAVLTMGSVSAAADTLSVSQPAISRHLRDLETRTGLALFTRMGNRLLPTDAARAPVLEIERSAATRCRPRTWSAWLHGGKLHHHLTTMIRMGHLSDAA